VENNLEKMIDGLDQAIKMEKTLQDYYKRAERASDDPDVRAAMHMLEDRHLSIVGRMRRRVEELERENGEGALGDAFQALGRAISDAVAGLPVGFIRTETDPSVRFLLEHEEQLLKQYNELRGIVDADTAHLVDAAAGNVRENIERLQAMVG